jgi:undecaprenyl-diphosphatase
LDFFAAIFLGLIQGLTEFLPISSSAHVQIAEQLFSLDSTLTKPQLTAFIATIQLGTEAAVLLFFWKDILRIAKAWFASLTPRDGQKTQDSRLGWLVIFGSLPVVAIGLLFKDQIEGDLRNLNIVAFTLIAFGLLLGLADKIGSKSKPIEQLTVKHGLLYGLGQALAVIPGVSRSGGTITVGLLLGYTRAAAARFSFLLAIPAVIASGLYEFAKTFGDLSQSALVATGIATVVSFVVGYLVIGYLLKYLERGSFMPFVLWRVGVGLLLIVGLATGMLTA